MYIYNDSYDSNTSTATYGGIAYKGKRYAWNSINPNMYDSTTGLFKAGEYTIKADDGSTLKILCENGSQPPEVSREYSLSADDKGIYVDGSLIEWANVKTASGKSFNPDNFESNTYYFDYNGIKASFTVEDTDDFGDVVRRLTTKWKSSYKLPYEDKAVFADFSNVRIGFSDNSQVKAFLNNNGASYIVRASDGSNGTTDGIWLTGSYGNLLSGSDMTWAAMGINNWGDQSTDIWSDKLYTYSYNLGVGEPLTIEFSVINETSKDSVIDALDGVEININSVSVSNHENLAFDTTISKNATSGTITWNTTRLSIAEEYGLGRDYSKTADDFNKFNLVYDATNDIFTVTHTDTVDNNTTAITYSNNAAQTQTIIDNIRNQIINDLNTNSYLDIVASRYNAGATNPELLNLAELINGITGKGANTYLEDAIDFNANNTSTLKSTYNIDKTKKYAGASIDFSGLGTNYQLADLLGLGFNSTCETCNNHYSIEFTNDVLTNTTWNTVNIGGKDYRYSSLSNNNNMTLYIDLESMMNNSITDGVNFTNVLVDILDKSGYDYHYSQYATYEDKGVLYVYDYRTQYVDADGKSTATSASFSPFSYNLDNKVNINLTMNDTTNNWRGFGLNYNYNYNDLFKSSVKYSYDPDPNGSYVQYNGNYVKYDVNNPNLANLQRLSYNATLDIGGQTIEAFIDAYIENTMFQNIANASQLSIVSQYANYTISANENDNKAMITEHCTPYQIKSRYNSDDDTPDGTLRIQCSSNTIDNINIKKQKLSLGRLGLISVSAKSQRSATIAIDKVSNALQKVSTLRSQYGAYQNRLEHSYAINCNTSENTQSAESGIRDTDMAREMVKYYSEKILLSASQSMLAQANQSKQGVLRMIG
jgi:flagellin-like hook-associated protein FlgL